MSGNSFFVSHIILAIVYKLFDVKYIVLLCLHNQCSFNPSGIFGLNSSINTVQAEKIFETCLEIDY